MRDIQIAGNSLELIIPLYKRNFIKEPSELLAPMVKIYEIGQSAAKFLSSLLLEYGKGSET